MGSSSAGPAAPAPSVRVSALDEAGIAALASTLGALLRAGDVVLLEGEMGAGKTTFTRALAAGLGVHRPDRVASPTYSVRVEHDGAPRLVHVDLCRMIALGEDDGGTGPAFEALGLDEWPSDDDRDAVLVVEWADAWRGAPTEHARVRLEIDPNDASRRDVTITGQGRVADAARALVIAARQV